MTTIKNNTQLKPLIDRKFFYDNIKKKLFTKGIKQSQVNGIEAVFNEWDSRPELNDLRWLSYMLATDYHETAATMQPIEEWGKGKGKKYGKKIKYSGVPYNLPNKLYYGRGLVMITWYEVYEQMGRLLGIDLLNNPEKACEMDVAVKIMFEGMLKGSSNFGDFTGKCLEMYFNDKVNDPRNARRIINILDKADLIVTYHNSFLSCLRTI